LNAACRLLLRRKNIRSASVALLITILASAPCYVQSLGQSFAQSPAPAHAKLPPPPLPLGVPKPGPQTEAPYAPQPILPGGVVVPLYPPHSPFLNAKRVREPEQYNMSQAAPGRINSIVNIHNPSIEVHTVESGLNTGAAVILAAGG
jgi:hypothetical protein